MPAICPALSWRQVRTLLLAAPRCLAVLPLPSGPCRSSWPWMLQPALAVVGTCRHTNTPLSYSCCGTNAIAADVPSKWRLEHTAEDALKKDGMLARCRGRCSMLPGPTAAVTSASRSLASWGSVFCGWVAAAASVPALTTQGLHGLGCSASGSADRSSARLTWCWP